MRIALMVLALVPTMSLGQNDGDGPPKRYGFQLNEKKFPQDSPAKSLASVINAVKTRKIGYLLAHLADPTIVDARVDRYAKLLSGGTEESRKLLAFERLTKETQGHFQQDPTLVKELEKLAKADNWMADDGTAVATYRALPGRAVLMKRVGSRWFLENRQRPQPPKK